MMTWRRTGWPGSLCNECALKRLIDDTGVKVGIHTTSAVNNAEHVPIDKYLEINAALLDSSYNDAESTSFDVSKPVSLQLYEGSVK